MTDKKNVGSSIMEKSEGNLNRSMKPHQIMMLGVGGTIGTGLFIGSGYVINQAGPGGTFLAYGFGALIMYLMMRCMGELLVEMPVAGGIQAYATEFVGDSMGFTIGWVKWLSLAITIPSQLVASSIILKNIFPAVHPIVWTVLFSLILFKLNAKPAEEYGSSSFWFSSIKFILIVVFFVVGLGIITGIIGGRPIGLSNFTNDGGLFPNGMRAVIMSMMTAAFAYGGADLIAATAGESENPEKDLPVSINSTIWGLIIAYAASLFILVAVLPWRSSDLMGSPFAYVFREAGLGGAELLVNVVVLTSALSSANAFVYSSTRTLMSMGLYKQAPEFVSEVNNKKIPMNALIITMLFAIISGVGSILSPDKLYLFLTSLIGTSNIFIYILYAVCIMKFRKRYTEAGNRVEDLKFRVPMYPLVPILLIVIATLVFIGMFLDPTQKMALATGIPTYIMLYLGYSLYSKNKKNKSIDNSKDIQKEC